MWTLYGASGSTRNFPQSNENPLISILWMKHCCCDLTTTQFVIWGKIVYNTNKQALAEFVKYELIRYLDEREKCEVLSKIFKTDVHELVALYVLKSFCGNIESYLTSGQQKIYTIFSEISKKEKLFFDWWTWSVSTHRLAAKNCGPNTGYRPIRVCSNRYPFARYHL